MMHDTVEDRRPMSSPIVRTAMRLILPLTLLFAAFMAIKGHNMPGGGFIGGLVGAVAVILARMSDGPGTFMKLVPVHPRLIVMVGLAIALATALVPLMLGVALLQSWVGYVPLPYDASVHLASAMAFDAGVFLVVVGVSVGMIQRLSEEVEAL